MPDESDRVTVSTYVPPYQRTCWREDAETLGMSQSEFVRAMVQAGRRGFALDGGSANPTEHGSSGSNPRSDGLKEPILELLREEGYVDWDELVEVLIGDVEDRLEAELDELLAENRITYNGRRGGYAIAGGSDGE